MPRPSPAQLKHCQSAAEEMRVAREDFLRKFPEAMTCSTDSDCVLVQGADVDWLGFKNPEAVAKKFRTQFVALLNSSPLRKMNAAQQVCRRGGNTVADHYRISSVHAAVCDALLGRCTVKFSSPAVQ